MIGAGEMRPGVTPRSGIAPQHATGGDAELRVRADENFREMYRHLARGSARGIFVERERGTCLIATGVPFALFNPAFVPPPLLLAGDGTEAGVGGTFLATARAFYQHEGLPWALVRDEEDHAGALATPRQMLLAGLRPVEALPVLVHPTRPGAHWPAPAPWLDVQAVQTNDQTADHRAVLWAAFGISEAMSSIVLPAVPASPLLVLYAAYDRATGRAVGSAALCEGGGLGGVYNVATHPDFRRKGVAATLMRTVLDDARVRGLQSSVLQSSPAGRSLYARLGFRHLKTYAVYVCDGTA